MSDIEVMTMPFEEKVTWVNLVVSIVVPIAYFALMFTRLQTQPVTEIAYQVPLLIAIGISIVLTIIGSIAVAVGSAVSSEIREPGSSKDLDRKDERDVHIGRRGELAGYYSSSAGMVVVLILTMLAFPYFWIANALYLSFIVGSVVSSSVKVAAYRRGF